MEYIPFVSLSSVVRKSSIMLLNKAIVSSFGLSDNCTIVKLEYSSLNLDRRSAILKIMRFYYKLPLNSL